MGRRLLCLLLLVMFMPLAAKDPPRPAPVTEDAKKLEALLDKVNAVQKGLQTLRVNFVQTNHFRMLSKPQVLRGVLTLKKPDTALYKYTSPSPLYFLVKDGDLLVYDPKDKKVLVQDIRRHQSRIVRYLGVGQPLDELRQAFDVTWQGQEGSTVHLVLAPTKYRMKRKLSALNFWVNAGSGYLDSFEVVELEGDRIRFDFTQWEANPTLTEDSFKVEIPPGVKVQRQLADFDEPFKP